MTLALRQSKLSQSKLWMCDAAVAEPEEAAETPTESVLDSLSPGNAEILETIKGLTLTEVAALIKDAEKTFGTGPKGADDEEEEAPAEE